MTKSAANRGVDEKLAALPHAYPFRFLDRVTTLNQEKGTAIKKISGNEPFIPARYNGSPAMPAVLVAEALAQLSGLVLSEKEGEPVFAYLAGLDNFRVTRPLRPGDTLDLEVKLEGAIGGTAKFTCKAYVDSILAAECELVLAVMPEK